MDTTVISNAAKQFGRTLDRNSPTILTALGVAGLLSSIIMAVKATPKAIEILEQEKVFRYEEGLATEPNEVIDTLDTIELTWKCYIPTIVMGAVTIGCMIGSNSISMRRSAAMASLLSITEVTLKEYQAKVVEKLGENKEETLRGEIAQKKVNDHPNDEKAIILTGKGEYLCLDTFSGRYFRSNVEDIRRAENRFNQKLLREGWLDINEFYDELGLGPIELGNQLGWIGQYALLEVKYNVSMAKNDEPCLVMDYRVQPKHI